MKVAGLIMITLFSTSLGLMAVNKKKAQLDYIDNLIYLGSRLSVILKSTMPETDEIFSILRADSRLSNLDIKSSLLSEYDNQKTEYLINSIGKFDIESQIEITEEFTQYFKMLKTQCQDYYNKHYKLYILLGLFSGITVSVLLI